MIKTISFDFAGVMTLDRLFPAFTNIVAQRYPIPKEEFQKNLYDSEGLYLVGEETTEAFWEKTGKPYGVALSDFEELLGSAYTLNPEMVDLVKKLKESYQVILHSDNFDACARKLRQDPVLTDLFEDMFFSHEMHATKKNESSFKYVLRQIQKEPHECIFTDDKEANLVAPAELGFHTMLFKDPDSLRREIERITEEEGVA